MYSTTTCGPRVGKDRVLWMHRRVVFRRIRAQIVAIVRVYVALHGGGGVRRREHKTVEYRERIKEIEFRERGEGRARAMQT